MAILKATKSKLLLCSGSLPWRGFRLRKQLFLPKSILNRSFSRTNRHLISMLCSPVSRGEGLNRNGQYVRYTKLYGAITILPSRLIAPPERLITPSEYLYCSFEEHFINRIVDEMDGKVSSELDFRSLDHDWQVSQILTLMHSEVKAGGPSGVIYGESLALALGTRFLALGTDLSFSQSSSPSVLPPRKLTRVKELIEANLEGDLSLKILARESGYSRAHFARLFRAATGMTPHSYVLERRILRARQLLTQPDLSLTDIAASSGFATQSHLTFAFRKKFGITPNAFRRKL
jgi:AraC family transcriptional regulator